MAGPVDVPASARVRRAPHERLEIALPSNPTTGYGWELDAPAAVRVVERSYVPGAPGVGAEGAERLVLEPLQPGTFALTLRYRRAWDEHVAAVREIELTVTASAP